MRVILNPALVPSVGEGTTWAEKFKALAHLGPIIILVFAVIGTMYAGIASPSEAAVVGVPHEIKGTGIAAFCTLASGHEPTDDLKQLLREHVGKEIGAIAKPDLLKFTDALPKTRSGKIMRRLLRDVAAGTDSNQDVTTLEDFSVLSKLREED